MFNWFKKRGRKPRKNEVILWAVTDNELYNESSIVYTVCPTEAGCYEYIDRVLYSKYKDHYENWKEYHNNADWHTYVQDVLLEYMEEEFFIIAFIADANCCALAYRVYEGCMPVGCSYEYPIEKIIRDHFEEDTKNKENSKN